MSDLTDAGQKTNPTGSATPGSSGSAPKTPASGSQTAGPATVRPDGDIDDRRAEPTSAAAKTVLGESDGPAGFEGNPYPNYDVMSLDQLREIADRRGVAINRDVEKAHLVTELRAADTHTR